MYINTGSVIISITSLRERMRSIEYLCERVEVHLREKKLRKLIDILVTMVSLKNVIL